GRSRAARSRAHAAAAGARCASRPLPPGRPSVRHRHTYTRRDVRRSTAIRVAAASALAVGLAAPLVRRRLRLPPPVTTATAATAPYALCLLVPRSRARDIGVCFLQMWAYVATYKMPYDGPEGLERRVRVAYPVRVDTAIGLGTTPTLRLQRALGSPGR